MRVFLKRILAFMPGSILAVLSSIEIEGEDQKSLVLDADGWLIGFDKPSQIVSSSGKRVTPFASVETVDIEHFTNGRRFEWWTLSLRLQDGKKLPTGRSVDGSQVSIAAAHVGKLMGKSVRVTKKSGF